MNISIFGLGYVGCVSLGCLAQNGHNVVGVDISPTKVGQINSGHATIIESDIGEIIAEQHRNGRIKATQDFRDAILRSDISILCVGTPSTPTGHLNLEYIFRVAEEIGTALAAKSSFHIVAIRSTVLPGTAAKVSAIISNKSGRQANRHFVVVSNPEFLREGSAVLDYYNPPFTLIGSDNLYAAEQLARIYQQLPAEIVMTDLRTAEIIKYVNNSFHALKIGFANEVGNVCKKLGIDAHKVMEIFIKDRQLNISPYYFKPGFAYGGSCLPKDLKALQTLAHDLYVDAPILNAAELSNSIQVKNAIDIVTGIGKKKIGFLGVTFKAGTDDLRNSPTVTVIETLLGKGFEIRIYDKYLQLARLTGTNREFIESHIPHLSELIKAEVDEVILASEVLVVSSRDDSLKEKLACLNEKYIVDLVRIDDRLLKMEKYIGICW